MTAADVLTEAAEVARVEHRREDVRDLLAHYDAAVARSGGAPLATPVSGDVWTARCGVVFAQHLLCIAAGVRSGDLGKSVIARCGSEAGSVTTLVSDILETVAGAYCDGAVSQLPEVSGDPDPAGDEGSRLRIEVAMWCMARLVYSSSRALVSTELQALAAVERPYAPHLLSALAELCSNLAAAMGERHRQLAKARQA